MRWTSASRSGATVSGIQSLPWTLVNPSVAGSDPHRHEHVQRRSLVVLTDQGRRGGIGEMDLDHVTVNLPEDVEQIAGVEADLEARRSIIAGHFLGGGAVFGAGHRQGDLVAIERHL